jgi:hypothetical protein
MSNHVNENIWSLLVCLNLLVVCISTAYEKSQSKTELSSLPLASTLPSGE